LRRGHSFSLGFHTTVFQAETCPIYACVEENKEKGYRGRNICIVVNSQVAIKALDSFYINCKSVWDCHHYLMKLTVHNRIQLGWLPGHMETGGNEIADE